MRLRRGRSADGPAAHIEGPQTTRHDASGRFVPPATSGAAPARMPRLPSRSTAAPATATNACDEIHHTERDRARQQGDSLEDAGFIPDLLHVHEVDEPLV